MSYDLSLYRPEFLERAITEKLGDWTGADPIALETARAIVEYLSARGYTEKRYPWTLGRCFLHPRAEWQIEPNLFEGSLSISVEFGPEIDAAVSAAENDAQEVSKLTGLAYINHQSGEIQGISPAS